MEDLIKNHIEYLMAMYKKTIFDIATIKLVLISKFNNKSLMYPHIARTWFAQYFALVQALGYGKFDKMSGSMILNTDNEYIQQLAVKYNIV